MGSEPFCPYCHSMKIQTTIVRVVNAQMTEVTTIQVSKETLADLNKKKLQFEAKLGKRISIDDYIQELLK